MLTKAIQRRIRELCDCLDMILSDFFDTEYFNSLQQEVK